MKLATMVGSLIAIQLTASLYSKDAFLLLNSMIFLIAVHGCICYPVQVVAWREGRIDISLFLLVHAAALILAAIYVSFYEHSYAVFIAVSLYVTYRVNERILFNLQISSGKVGKAYRVMCVALTLEIATLLGVYFTYGSNGDRFILPSMVAMAFTIPVALSEIDKGSFGNLRNMLTDKTSMLLMSAHSGLIAFNVMSDRIVFAEGLSKLDSYLSDYLLIFSYCSSAYALTVSLIEVKRPHLFRIPAGSLYAFLRKGGFLQLFAAAAAIGLFSSAAISAFFTYNPVGLGLTPGAPVVIFATLITTFFLGQAVLSFVHVYYLSERLYAPLFFTWAVSGIVRTVAYLQSNWTMFLIISALSGFAGVFGALVHGRLRLT
ncbi:hypothetical protein [Sphingobium sp. CFD-2]|uniref:hypothetical protein n=1 Tax=Sphingobium sp. CFD-2 TaxID=2878542 RepID=UPI00214B7D94|nr:hypothetical protein [Sphingobium sp. CFD-2]